MKFRNKTKAGYKSEKEILGEINKIGSDRIQQHINLGGKKLYV
jgi:hypothetical protein